MHVPIVQMGGIKFVNSAKHILAVLEVSTHIRQCDMMPYKCTVVQLRRDPRPSNSLKLSRVPGMDDQTLKSCLCETFICISKAYHWVVLHSYGPSIV